MLKSYVKKINNVQNRNLINKTLKLLKRFT